MENQRVCEPYIGLRPYTEEYGHMFFGREAEQSIIIDKLLSEKCTMLFAASGVGKSSLLQAGVIPELKDPKRHNLNVVYFKDWVINPLSVLIKTIESTLKLQGAIDNEYYFTDEYSFKDFLQVCASFSSEPLIIVLDQFEEVFHYQRYVKDFDLCIRQMAEALCDKKTNVNFLISMREDFALYMNAFKGHLPTTIFENYFRLEKLDIRRARKVIEWPVEQCGFRYETGLLDELIEDLSNQEREGEIGISNVGGLVGGSQYVEAPNVQIVCKQLWEIEHSNPEKIIQKKTYYENGRASGFIRTYFDSVISTFSKIELTVSSRALTHLVTPRGTKMAYPVTELSHILRIKENDLTNVLYKLESARVLRCQIRNGEVWYELYHDIFSRIINDWNERYKTKQRDRNVKILAGCCAVAFVLLFAFFNNSIHIRLSKKIKSDNIELYKGRAGAPGIIFMNRFLDQTPYTADQIEPDKVFIKKTCGSYSDLNDELIGLLPITNRMEHYMKTGNITKSFELAHSLIRSNNQACQDKAISILAGCNMLNAFRILMLHLREKTDIKVKIKIVNALASVKYPGITDTLISFLNDENAEIRIASIKALGMRGDKKAVRPIVNLYNNRPDNIENRILMAEVLAELGSSNAANILVGLLEEKLSPICQKRVLYALECIGRGGVEIIEPMIRMLNAKEQSIRIGVIELLGKLGSTKATPPLIELLNDRHLDDITKSTILEAMGKLKDERAIISIISILNKRTSSSRVRLSAVYALSESGSENAIEPLIKIIQENKAENETLITAVKGLRSTGNAKALEMLFKIPDDEKYKFDIRTAAIDVLGDTENSKAKMALVSIANGKNIERKVQLRAIKALSSSVNSRSDIEQMSAACSTLIYQIRNDAIDLNGNDLASKKLDSLNQINKHQEQEIKVSKYEAIQKLGDKKIFTPLCSILLDKNALSEIRIRATRTLFHLGNENDLEVLTREVANSENDAHTLDYAACVMGALGCEKAMDQLIQILNGTDDSMRLLSIEALGYSGSEIAIEPLKNLLNDSNAEIRKSAGNALLKINPSLMYLYSSGVSGMKKSSELKNTNKKSVLQLQNEATDTSLLMSRRLKAIHLLGANGSLEAGRALMMILKTTSRYYQFAVIIALKRARYTEALPILRDSLNSENDRVVKWRKVRDRNTKKFDEYILEKWHEELDFYKPRRALAFELANAVSTIDTCGKMGIGLLIHELAAVREGAYSGLSKHADPELVNQLFRLRKKYKNPFFDQCAYNAIDGILLNLEANGDRRVCEKLQKIQENIQDTCDAVYARIAWTLGKM